MPSVGHKTAVTVVSSLCSNTVCYQQEPGHKNYQKFAAWTSFPLTEGEPVQSANLCLLCNLLHMHSSAVDLLFQKVLAEFGAF